ncbi:hypothetical protein BDV97DRAFT_197378 [Delphinella strobiligena]|nr:hypothetical protein BDV97DRAFT_197378 [Delphinella strobiligena]
MHSSPSFKHRHNTEIDHHRHQDVTLQRHGRRNDHHNGEYQHQAPGNRRYCSRTAADLHTANGRTRAERFQEAFWGRQDPRGTPGRVPRYPRR